MNSKAVRPLDHTAVNAANKQLYQDHPELTVNGKPRPLDPTSPQDRQLRAEWMASYAKAGGATEPVNSQSVAKTRDAIGKKFKAVPPGYTVLPCGKVVPVKLLPPPPRALPPQPPGDPPCELLTATFQCGHGRQAGPNRILMVVPGEDSNDDMITASLAMKGGCGAHPAWDYGPTPTATGKSTSFHYKASAPGSMSNAPMFRWWRTPPVTTRAAATACAGVSGDCDIHAYPGGEATLSAELAFEFKPTEHKPEDKLDFRVAASSKYHGQTDKLSFSFWKMSDVFHKIIEVIGDKFAGLDPLEDAEAACKIGVSLKASAKSEWKEESDWRARCESEIRFGADPLFEIGGELPIWALPIPPKVSRWVRLGLFCRPVGKVALTFAHKWTFWPDSGKEKTLALEGEGAGEIKLGLFAKLRLCSPDFLSGTASGDGSIEVTGNKLEETESGIHYVVKLKPLTVTLNCEALWGLVSYDREYELTKEKELCNKNWIFEK